MGVSGLLTNVPAILSREGWAAFGRCAEGCQRRWVVPVREEKLRVAVGCAIRGPAKPFAVGRKGWQAVEAVRERHANRLVLARGIDDEQFEIGKAEFVRRENDVFAARMIIRRP